MQWSYFLGVICLPRLLSPQSAQAALSQGHLGSWYAMSLAAVLDGKDAALALSKALQRPSGCFDRCPKPFLDVLQKTRSVGWILKEGSRAHVGWDQRGYLLLHYRP